jgi:hypothetical protein
VGVLRVHSLRALLLAISLSFIEAKPVNASTDEYTLMALYIYNFAKFTRWPNNSFQSPKSSLNLCVLGDDPFGAALDSIEGRLVDTHSLSIDHYPRVAVAKGCHILFVSQSEEDRLGLILNEISELAILSISDIEGFSERGGMITLVTQDQKIRFNINSHATSLVGIELSSKLLELASKILDGGK